RWQLVDDNDAVLAAVADAMRRSAAGTITAVDPLAIEGPGFACRAVLVRADLASRLDALEWPARGLVTASALLDLVSSDWLDALAEHTAAAGAAALFALSYDGRLSLEPAHRDDALVRALVNLHQRRDKG